MQLSMWGVFCHNLGITTNTLENRFKSKFSFNNGNFFKIHDHFRTRESPRFNDVSQLINALSLSNQDFSGLDNFNQLDNLFCTQGIARRLSWYS